MKDVSERFINEVSAVISWSDECIKSIYEVSWLYDVDVVVGVLEAMVWVGADDDVDAVDAVDVVEVDAVAVAWTGGSSLYQQDRSSSAVGVVDIGCGNKLLMYK